MLRAQEVLGVAKASAVHWWMTGNETGALKAMPIFKQKFDIVKSTKINK